MTDKEMIANYRTCQRQKQCEGCPLEKEDRCVVQKLNLDGIISRLEGLMAENERLKAQLPKWRPAGNPPKESVTIFARDMAGVVTTAYYNGSWHGMLNCDAVTHWMPLPSTEGVE